MDEKSGETEWEWEFASWCSKDDQGILNYDFLDLNGSVWYLASPYHDCNGFVLPQQVICRQRALRWRCAEILNPVEMIRSCAFGIQVQER